MPVFILNIIILLVYATLINLSTSLNKATQRVLFLNIAFVHLLFLHTFFDPSLFPDLDNYFDYFSNISNFKSYDIELEIGWTIINKILYSISTDSLILLFFVSTIMLLCYFITINSYSSIPWLSIFILLCTVFYDSLFVLRQHLAMAICLLSIPYIIKRKPIKFLLVTLLAISFHNSALVWIPVYIVYSFEINRRFVFMLIVLTSLFYFTTEIILGNLILVTRKIMAYTDPENQGTINAFKGSAVVLSILVLSLYSFKKVDKIKGYNKLFFQLSMIAFVLNFLPFFASSFTLFSRLHLYYSISGIFLIPNALANISNKKLYYILTPVICVCYLFLLNAFVQYGYGF
jgi:hypothetical protein